MENNGVIIQVTIYFFMPYLFFCNLQVVYNKPHKNNEKGFYTN